MDIVDSLCDYKGCIVRLRTDEGEFEGIVKNVCLDVKKVSLFQVSMIYPSEVCFQGIQSFYLRDIKSCSVVSSPGSGLEVAKSTNRSSLPNYRALRSCKYEADICFKDLTDEECVSDRERENVLPEDYEEEEYLLQLPEHLLSKLPNDHVIINEVNDTFHEAVEHISNECVIGVSFEGENIGRFGKMCWIGVSTASCTFLFDIMNLQEKCFTEGLKGVLESSGITKVIHDCRQPSDGLFHQYNVVLTNVFDTQLADAFVCLLYSKTGEIPQSVQSLYMCAKKYLNLGPGDVHGLKVSSSAFLGTEWAHRPLRNDLHDRAIKNVIYLRLLKSRLEEEMIRPFYNATNIYLNVVRNASEKELHLKPSVPHLLPQSLLAAGLQVVRIKSFQMADGTYTGSSSSITGQQLDNLTAGIEEAKKFRPLKSKMNLLKLSDEGNFKREADVVPDQLYEGISEFSTTVVSSSHLSSEQTKKSTEVFSEKSAAAESDTAVQANVNIPCSKLSDTMSCHDSSDELFACNLDSSSHLLNEKGQKNATSFENNIVSNKESSELYRIKQEGWPKFTDSHGTHQFEIIPAGMNVEHPKKGSRCAKR